MTDLVLIALATWYVSYAVTSTDGPFAVFLHLRNKTIRGHYWHGGVLKCPVCLAPWAALVLLLVPMGIVVQALALAGAAMLLHGLANWRFGGG